MFFFYNSVHNLPILYLYIFQKFNQGYLQFSKANELKRPELGRLPEYVIEPLVNHVTIIQQKKKRLK